ncbi:HD domain-containing protein [Mycolicibacterium neworleansense]|uniref:Putative metal-dependent phosphohydrolase n=1 Tax=Mycolicibacterium neworleansense TaxID=146018 RepID=A0A0H5RSG2_9MYCO|nr:HD domain-containing protein [Mycolicibacterium neworleansense]MCV7361401.1 phosphohydrolase [Mycolicibacterium neworleansense]CRZ16751.1 putative metal-dependent phosphohydrolase [Mycolicibacterium neworleansense]
MAFRPLVVADLTHFTKGMATTELDWQWSTRSGGALTTAQRRALLRPLIRALPAMVGDAIRTRRGRRGQGRLDFGSIRLPDSALARAAEQEARDVLSPHVLEHSYRTYFFGKALADIDGVTVDDELVYVASLLHDLNLEQPTRGRCFAVAGAERAVQFVSAHGGTEERAQAVGAAIAAHITVGVSENLADAGGFVSAGAGTDVFGLRMSELSAQWVDELLLRHPRLEFKRHLLKAWAAESAAVPDGRAAWMTRYAAFPLLIRLAPYSS